MIELIIGLIWNLVITIVTFLLYFTDTTVKVNGVYTNHEEFVNLLWPKLLLGLFGIAGIIVLIIGIKKLLKNNKTEKNGEKCFGKICGIRPTGARFLGKPVYKVFIATYIQSLTQINIVKTGIGTDNDIYPIDSFVIVKYYKGHTKMENIIDENIIPQGIREQIEKSVEQYNQTHQTVTIKGVDITVEK